MCHGDASRPPRPEGAGKAASESPVELTAWDGNRFAAHAARSAAPTGAGVVVMPDVRGLHPLYRDLAVRFAEIGVEAVAIDYFGRSAGIGDRSEAFDWVPHVTRTEPDGVAADVAAAVAFLRSEAGGAVRSVFTVGFCFGGGYSWRQSASQPGLAGAIGFYGAPQRAAEVTAQMKAPLLMLISGADEYVPVEEEESVAEAARAAGVPVEFAVYDGAPHSYFDRSSAEHQKACADSWQRIREFIRANTSEYSAR
jgi:carboxymethylenebutenolidase